MLLYCAILINILYFDPLSEQDIITGDEDGCIWNRSNVS